MLLTWAPPQLGHFHILSDIVVPITGVVAVALDILNYPHGAVLDFRPACLKTLNIRLFILSSSDLRTEKKK